MIKMRPEVRKKMNVVVIILGTITFAIIVLAIYKLYFKHK
jgi:hypothetical protein